MGSLLLKWVLSNKMLTAAILVVAVLATLLVVCKLENSLLRMQNANQKAALTELESLCDIQKRKIQESRKTIDAQKAMYAAARRDLAAAKVPQACPEAVTWGSQQINAIMEGVK